MSKIESMRMEAARLDLEIANNNLEASKVVLHNVQSQLSMRQMTIAQVAATLLAGDTRISTILDSLTLAELIVDAAGKTREQIESDIEAYDFVAEKAAKAKQATKTGA